MVKDAFNSILDNFKERTTNPFLGTLVIVWLVHNWKLVYKLFNFNPKLPVDSRIRVIENHFKETSFEHNLLYVILMTFLVLSVTYLLLILARLLTDAYDKFGLPWIAKITDKNSIVLKSRYNELQEVVKQLEVRLEEERQAKVGAQNERDTLDQKLHSLTSTSIEEKGTSPSELEETFRRVTKKFEDDDNVEKVNSLIGDIQTTRSIVKNDSLLLIFLREAFAEFKQNDQRVSGRGYYVMTEEGKQFLRFWNRLHG